MGFQLPLILLVTAGVVLTRYADKIPRCRYPCVWRNKPLLDEKDSVWFINTPTIGFYTNLSRPIGDQTSPTECIMRHGPFFLEREYGKFSCFKSMTISDTDWYFYFSEESDTLKSFCELCDGSKFEGPFYSSDQQSNLDRTRPIGCNLPSICPITNEKQVKCPDSEPYDNGRNCKVQRSNRRYRYNRQQRYDKHMQLGNYGYRTSGAY
ncbi:unnamed protein product [Mytilus edulis]|uniref:Uncharacterized protein n=1 Tax=Mytilus edulis TaxID=6550 RepID=A0A8S3RC70_MYTED|nr:unnamed protein product [Mytilus edulis]